MRRFRLMCIDAFTRTPFAGNAAAVVLAADGLSVEQMQAVARELNLSETAFVFEENAAGEIPVRFFTPRQEVAVCGHATLAAQFARGFATHQPVGDVVQRSDGGAWRVQWRLDEGAPFVTMRQGPVAFGAVLRGELRAQLLTAVGIDEGDVVPDWPVQVVSTGHEKVLLPLTSPARLAAVNPNFAALTTLSARCAVGGFFAFALMADGHGTSARMFGPAIGVNEDPVNGSGHGPLGAYLSRRSASLHALASSGFWSSMGAHMQRAGSVFVALTSDPAWVDVGGHVALIYDTHISLSVA